MTDATAAIDAALAQWLDNEPTAYVPIRDDILAALAAAGYVVERGWQPIESAPPMEPVLVFGGEVRYPVTASWTGVLDEPWALDALQDIGQEIDPPTHWRRLPDPPAAEAEAKETGDE